MSLPDLPSELSPGNVFGTGPLAEMLPEPFRIVPVAELCMNIACSRFGTSHDGRPCDTRRARGVGGKR